MSNLKANECENFENIKVIEKMKELEKYEVRKCLKN